MPRRNSRKPDMEPDTKRKPPRKKNPIAKDLRTIKYRPRIKPNVKRSRINEERARDAKKVIDEGFGGEPESDLGQQK